MSQDETELVMELSHFACYMVLLSGARTSIPCLMEPGVMPIYSVDAHVFVSTCWLRHSTCYLTVCWL